jgi:hypothetical protein
MRRVELGERPATRLLGSLVSHEGLPEGGLLCLLGLLSALLPATKDAHDGEDQGGDTPKGEITEVGRATTRETKERSECERNGSASGQGQGERSTD